MLDTPDLAELLSLFRRLHVAMLEKSINTRETQGSCLYSALVLAEGLSRWIPGANPRIHGGDGKQDGGYFDEQGRGYGHYWVELEHAGQFWVADLTADQFGGEPIVLMAAAEARDRYRPGNQVLVDEAVSEERAALGFVEAGSAQQ